MRFGRALSSAGWALLGLLALAGVVVSGAVLFAASPWGRSVVANAVIRLVDDALAGRFELEGVVVLPNGGVGVRGLRVFDPHEHLVLAVDRARVFVDVTALRSRVLGLAVELDGPSVLVEEEEGGGISLARAFAAARPGPDPEPEVRTDDGRGLTVRVSRLVVRGGDVWWVDAKGATRIEASGLDLDARGSYGPRDADVVLALRGTADLPLPGPIALDLAATKRGDALFVPVLRAVAGGTAVAAVAEGDLGTLVARAAASRIGLAREEARSLVPALGGGADLEATAYAESSGSAATIAVRAVPVEETPAAAAQGGTGTAAAAAPGSADAAVAIRFRGARALGFDVAADRLDPARVHAAAPSGEVTLAGHGALGGTSLDDLRGRLRLTIARSRLRGGEVHGADVVARADRGAYVVERLLARAPGLSVEGGGRWRPGASVVGSAVVEGDDVRRALENLSALLATDLPALGGRARVQAVLGGTAREPRVDATIASSAIAGFGLSVSGAALRAQVSGPLRRPAAMVEGRVERLRRGADELARGIVLEARLAGDDGALSASASVPGMGTDPVRVDARGRLAPRREALLLSELALAYPGARYALVRPATLRFEGPSVDRLELASGEQRIAIEGGLGRRGALDAHLEVSGLELATLPASLLPRDLLVRGRLSADLFAVGTTSRPRLEGRVALRDGRFQELDRLDVDAVATWDAGTRRATAALGAERGGGGGSVEVSLDVPMPFAPSAGGPIAARIRARDVALLPVLAAAGVEAPPVDGTVSLLASMDGTFAAPALRAEVTVTEGAYDALYPLGLAAEIESAGERAEVRLRGAYDGTPLLVVDGAVPLDPSELLARPAETIRALVEAPLEADVTVPGAELALFAGTFGIPEDAAGTVSATARLEGTALAPRGDVRATLAGGAVAGWRELGAAVEIALEAARVTVRGEAAVGGDPVVRVDGAIAGAPEGLLSLESIRAAPLELEAVVPRVALSRAAGVGLPVEGEVEGRAELRGSLAAPVARAELAARAVKIDGRALGDVTATARHAAGRSEVAAEVRATAGGTVAVEGSLGFPLGLGAARGRLRDAPLEGRLVATALDLRVVPALAPGIVRAATGTLSADVTARGPLGRPSPRGELSIAGARVALSELGEWTDIAVAAAVSDDAIEVRELSARRGRGTLSASGFLRGLSEESSRLEARLAADELSVLWQGQEQATLDLEVTAEGSYAANALRVEARIPEGIVRLPDRPPRDLQSLEGRPDIVIGPKPPERKRPTRAVPIAVPAAAAAAKPFSLALHVVAPGQLFVRGDNPEVNVELQADVTYERIGEEGYASGEIEVVRGTVEPIGGRVFAIERGRVQFTGGPPTAAMIDVEARYDNPQAVVTVTVAGPARDPEIRLSSEPPMDEAQIAMLIATGRTELKRNTGEVGALTGEEAGKAALGVLANQAFKNLVADKLPVDTLTVDSGSIRAGRYFGDDFYVGYIRRFDADPERGENENEYVVEYQLTPRWAFESRYGSSQSAAASLIWSRDY
jgi:translocation and assembly module TamB